ILNAETGVKRLELARELLPRARVIGLLVNPSDADADAEAVALEPVIRSSGQSFVIGSATSESELASTFAMFAARGVEALILGIHPFFNDRYDVITALAARFAIPTVYYSNRFVGAGGLISYGGDTLDAYRQTGILAGLVLKGSNPSDL